MFENIFLASNKKRLMSLVNIHHKSLIESIKEKLDLMCQEDLMLFFKKHTNRPKNYKSMIIDLFSINENEFIKKSVLFENSLLNIAHLKNYVEFTYDGVPCTDLYINGVFIKDIDKIIYLSSYQQWCEKYTKYTYKGCDISIHNHELIEIIDSLPYKKDFNGFEKIHPKNFLKDNYKNEIDKILEKHYNLMHSVFDYETVLNIDGFNARLLTTAQELIQEGKMMNHCVGGVEYIEDCLNNNMYIYHVDIDGVEKGVTVAINKNEYGEYSIYEAYGYSNQNIDEKTNKYLDDMLIHINDNIR